MQGDMHVVLQKTLILFTSSLMYGCTGSRGLQDPSCFPAPPASPQSIAEAELRESYYLDGQTLKKRAWMSSEEQVVAYEWYLPSGEVLWQANWLCEVCGHSHESGLFLDDQGDIRQVIQFCDNGTQGYGLTFDPPVAPSRIRKYVDGQVVEEYDISTEIQETNSD